MTRIDASKKARTAVPDLEERLSSMRGDLPFIDIEMLRRCYAGNEGLLRTYYVQNER